jgi:hypothetical protein
MAAFIGHPTLREVHLHNFDDFKENDTKHMCTALGTLPALELLSFDYSRDSSPRAAELVGNTRGLLLASLADFKLKAFSYRLACFPNKLLPAFGAADMAATLRRLELSCCVMPDPEEEGGIGRALLALPLFPQLEELRLEFIREDWGPVTDALLRALLAPLAAHRPAGLRAVAVALPAAALHGDLRADRRGGALSWDCCRELMAAHAGLTIEFTL